MGDRDGLQLTANGLGERYGTKEREFTNHCLAYDNGVPQSAGLIPCIVFRGNSGSETPIITADNLLSLIVR